HSVREPEGAAGCAQAFGAGRGERKQSRATGATVPTPTATSFQAVRQPWARTEAPIEPKAIMNQMLSSKAKTPMATPVRCGTALPTTVMLATDNPLCPSARVASNSAKSIVVEPATAPIRQTTPAKSKQKTALIQRAPKRSSIQPAGKQKTAPS